MDSKKEQDGKFHYFTVEGSRYRTNLTRKYGMRKPWAPIDPNLITAEIPGTIVKINVKEGQKVAEGKCLFVLEAMKMNNKFNSPRTAMVKKIHIEEGQILKKEQLVMELEDVEEKKPKARSRSKS